MLGRTRELLEQLAGSGARISIATKSDLVLRDLDLIKTFPDARVSWSVNTLDEGFKNDMDNAMPLRLTWNYVTNDDSMQRPFDAPPVIVNYFYHERIKKSARKDSFSSNYHIFLKIGNLEK